MKDIKFNWCLPREYKDKATGEIKYAIFRGGDRMDVGTLADMQKWADKSKPKNAQPWGQAFTNGYRVTSETLDYSEWNGITFADVDSKWYYKLCKPFNTNKLMDAIAKYAPQIYDKNYYASHLTNSMQGYRIFWYWDCERNEDNFKKCCILTEQFTRELFYSFGDQAKEIIDYEDQGHRVLDKCSNSIMQGFYVTANEIHYSPHINEDGFGSIDLSDITIELAWQSSNVMKASDGFDQKRWCKAVRVEEVTKDSIRYYPHQHRRCIFEALEMIYSGKELEEQWDRVCRLMPEGNGHDYEFYKSEPVRCKWAEKTNSGTMHDMHWLDPFGYIYEDKTEYIYFDQFRKSWKRWMKSKALAALYEEKAKQYDAEHGAGQFAKMHKDDQEKVKAAWRSTVDMSSIFDKSWDEAMPGSDTLEECRGAYWKTRWEPRDFSHLCDGYEIAKDIVTYKMYADFYYRDRDNLPLLKYNVLEDEILTWGWWPETYKKQWHTFKYGNEYTHWKNGDTFSSKCVKTDMTEAVNKFVQRWFAFHSIKDYLNSLDLSKANEELLETWAIRYFNAADTELTRTVSKNFFIAAVKKQMVEDPTKFIFQHMLFLQGASGCGKTAFLVTMFTIDGKSYILNKIDPNGKDNEIGPLIAKNWMIQFGESENLKKVSVNAAKEFLDRINLGMKYQKKYENEQTTIYPRIVACRTSNDDVLFNDISVNVDRRNWLIECRVPEDNWDGEMQKKLEAEKDILWATAYKLYLDNPEASLELPRELFKELGQLQEKHKLIREDEIKEIYDEIFERVYFTNSKKEVMDEWHFNKMLERSDEALRRKDVYVSELLDNTSYVQEHKIDTIPSRWLSSWVKKKYSLGHMKKLRELMEARGWRNKTVRYNDKVTNCLARA